MPVPLAVKNCIQLASCDANQLLPMNPELPADLFTSCLSTPIKVALRWWVAIRNLWGRVGASSDLISVTVQHFRWIPFEIGYHYFFFRFCSQKSSKLVPGITLELIEKWVWHFVNLSRTVGVIYMYRPLYHSHLPCKLSHLNGRRFRSFKALALCLSYFNKCMTES